MDTTPEVIFAKQSKTLGGFHYLVTDSVGGMLGEINWPMYAQATNARLKVHTDDLTAGSVRIRCGQGDYLIEFEYLQRGWQNDTRYKLRADDRILASASMVFKRGLLKRGTVCLELPVQATFVGRWAWFRRCFDLISPDGYTRVGRIEELSLISTTRRLRAELPGMELPQQAFCLFLGLHLIQTQF